MRDRSMAPITLCREDRSLCSASSSKPANASTACWASSAICASSPCCIACSSELESWPGVVAGGTSSAASTMWCAMVGALPPNTAANARSNSPMGSALFTSVARKPALTDSGSISGRGGSAATASIPAPVVTSTSLRRSCSTSSVTRSTRGCAGSLTASPLRQLAFDAARRVHELRKDDTAQLLQGHPSRMGTDVDGGKRPPPPIAQRRCHGADSQLELLIDQRVALTADGVDLGPQHVGIADRLHRRSCVRERVEEVVELRVRQAGQQPPPHRRPRRGQP